MAWSLVKGGSHCLAGKLRSEGLRDMRYACLGLDAPADLHQGVAQCVLRVDNYVDTSFGPPQWSVTIAGTQRKQAFTVDCFDDIVLLMPLLAPAAS